MTQSAKRCSLCKKLKLAVEFNRDSSKKSGRQSRCRSCDPRTPAEPKMDFYFRAMDNFDQHKFSNLLKKWEQENAQMV